MKILKNIPSMDELLLLGSAPFGGINGTNEFLISIKYLINEHNMNIYDNIYDGDNLLGYAVLRNNIDIVKYLIE